MSHLLTCLVGTDAEEEIENETTVELDQPSVPRDHIRLPIIVNQLPCLRELRITYGVRRCGLNFNWNIYQFTLKVFRYASFALAIA